MDYLFLMILVQHILQYNQQDNLHGNFSITIWLVIDLVHSNCFAVPLWSGHQYQSPALSLCLLKQPLHLPLGADTLMQSSISAKGSENPLIITVGTFKDLRFKHFFHNWLNTTIRVNIYAIWGYIAHIVNTFFGY